MLVIRLPSAMLGGATSAWIVHRSRQRGSWINSWNAFVIGALVGTLSGVGAIMNAYLITDDWYLSVAEWAVVLTIFGTVGAVHASLIAGYLSTAGS